MYQAMFYKEWIKTRWIILLSVLVFAGFIAYIFISTAQVFRLSGAVSAWEGAVMKDMQLMSAFKWLPLLVAVVLALGQYMPEMQNKRLKLTLHLPLPESKILSSMLCYGLLVLIGIYGISYLILLPGLRSYYPSEIILNTYWATVPWFLAGLTAYLLTAWICLEPVWKYRIAYALAGVSALSFFFISAKSGAYATFFPYLLGFFIISFSFAFFSTARFKAGEQ